MHKVMTVEEFACWYYRVPDGEPTKSQANSVRRMCRDGTIAHAEKMGCKWFIDCTAEWPGMFPDEEPRREPEEAVRVPAITADMRLGDALATILDVLVQGKEEESGKQKGDAAQVRLRPRQ